MGKSGKRKRSSSPKGRKPQDSLKKGQKTIDKEIEQDRERTRYKVEHSENARLVFERRFSNFIVKALYIICATLLIALTVSLLGCVVCYFLKATQKMGDFLTGVQVFTGIVSLVIGIWGLALSIRAEKAAAPDSHRELGVNVSSINRRITGEKENDINPSSL